MTTAQRRWTPALLGHLVVVLAVLVGGVAGAGWLRGRGPAGDVLEVVNAASTSAAGRTFRATFSFGISGSGFDMTSTGEMLIDQQRQVQAGSMSMPAGGRVEFRQLGQTVYLKAPGVGGSRPWLSYTSQAGTAAVGAQDPLQMLRLLSDPDGVRTLGRETVNDVRATHYRLRVDPQRLTGLATQNPDAPAIPPGAADQLGDVTTDLWVDDDQLPRRMVMAMQVQAARVSFRFDFLDYDRPVEVEAPPADQVEQVTDVGAFVSRLRTG